MSCLDRAELSEQEALLFPACSTQMPIIFLCTVSEILTTGSEQLEFGEFSHHSDVLIRWTP